MMVERFDDLRIYQQSFDLSVRIYELSRAWPMEEMRSLTSQIRRSSRPVCANIAEAWRKRRYPAHFVSKLSDADAESAETQNWLKFARQHGFVGDSDFSGLYKGYDMVIGGLVKMMAEPEKWCGPASLVREESVEYEIG